MKEKANYQNELENKGSALKLTGAQNNPSVRVTSKQKVPENSMGAGAATAGAAIVDLDLHGAPGELEGGLQGSRLAGAAQGRRAPVGFKGQKRGGSQGGKQWTQFPLKV